MTARTTTSVGSKDSTQEDWCDKEACQVRLYCGLKPFGWLCVFVVAFICDFSCHGTEYLTSMTCKVPIPIVGTAITSSENSEFSTIILLSSYKKSSKTFPLTRRLRAYPQIHHSSFLKLLPFIMSPLRKIWTCAILFSSSTSSASPLLAEKYIERGFPNQPGLVYTPSKRQAVPVPSPV